MAADQKVSEFTGYIDRKFDILRLICCSIILLSIFLAIQFDWFVHMNEIARYHGEAPGDFLTFRSYAVLATHPHATLHIAVPFLYPPPFLLFTAPLSWLSPTVGFIVWIAGGNLCLALAARLVNIPWKAIGLGLITEPNLFCAVTGQSGILVSCFLLAAFGLAETQPVLSGLAAGLVIIKPQFGLLIPVCYFSTGNWRAAVAAIASAASLCLLTTIFFGAGIWQSFQTNHITSAGAMLTPAWPAEFQIMMITPYILFRSFYASLIMAGGAQTAVSIAAAFACWRLWRSDIEIIDRLPPTLCLVALATPYAYIYDLPALGASLAALAITGRIRGLVVFTLFLAFTCLYALLSVYLFSTGALFLTIILFLTWPSPPNAGIL